jgi:hypothetical protein
MDLLSSESDMMEKSKWSEEVIEWIESCQR